MIFTFLTNNLNKKRSKTLNTQFSLDELLESRELSSDRRLCDLSADLKSDLSGDF